MEDKLLRKYAKLAVCSGVNVQKGQLLVISASVKDYKFAQMCVEEAYKAGAGQVYVEWSCEEITLLNYQNCSVETLCEFPQWMYDKMEYAQNKGACFLHIISETPGLLKDVDQNKIKASKVARMQKMAPLVAYTMANKGQWSIVAVPSAGWAKQVFPEKSEEEAIEALWNAIYQSVRISQDNDPVEQWKEHNATLAKHCEVMNAQQFSKLHFVSELGTDLYVGLVKDHIWEGGSTRATGNNAFFNPNMPTEEIFSMPDRMNVNGKVVASKPLDYNGKLVENFGLTFKDGQVVDYYAEKGLDALQALLETDEGSRRLGEVALISYHSPISLMNILFFNTLFDENASCHLALGRCYPENIKGGYDMSKEELLAHGGNDSFNHVDFMFGTSDMSVIGIKENGEEVVVFDHGDFAF